MHSARSAVWPGGWHFAPGSCGPFWLLPGPKSGTANAGAVAPTLNASVVSPTRSLRLVSSFTPLPGDLLWPTGVAASCTARSPTPNYGQTCFVWPGFAPTQVPSVPGASTLPRCVSVNLGLFLVGSSTVLQPGSPASHGGGAAVAPEGMPINAATASVASENRLTLLLTTPRSLLGDSELPAESLGPVGPKASPSPIHGAGVTSP